MTPPKIQKPKPGTPQQRKGKSTQGAVKAPPKHPLKKPSCEVQVAATLTTSVALHDPVPFRADEFLLIYLDKGILVNKASSADSRKWATALTIKFSKQLKQAMCKHPEESKDPLKGWQIQISEQGKVAAPKQDFGGASPTGFRVSSPVENKCTEEVGEVENVDLCDGHAAPVAKTTPLQIRNKSQVTLYLRETLRSMNQLNCKAVAKQWIKIIEPGKQGKHPYNGGRDATKAGIKGTPAANELKKPRWWPEGIDHKEPDHQKTEMRLGCLVDILRMSSQGPILDGRQFTVAMLKESTSQQALEFLERDRALLEEIYRVRRLEERYEQNKIDGNYETWVTPFSAPKCEKVRGFFEEITTSLKRDAERDAREIFTSSRYKRPRTWKATPQLKEEVALTTHTPPLAIMPPESPTDRLNPRLNEMTVESRKSGIIATGPRPSRRPPPLPNFHADKESWRWENQPSIEPLYSPPMTYSWMTYEDQSHPEHTNASPVTLLQTRYNEQPSPKHSHESPISYIHTEHSTLSPHPLLHQSPRVPRLYSELSTDTSQTAYVESNKSVGEHACPESVYVSSVNQPPESSARCQYESAATLDQDLNFRPSYTYSSSLSPATNTPIHDSMSPYDTFPYQMSAYQNQDMIYPMSGRMMHDHRSGFNTDSIIKHPHIKTENLIQQTYQPLISAIQTELTTPVNNSSIQPQWSQIEAPLDASAVDSLTFQLKTDLPPVFTIEKQALCDPVVGQILQQEGSDLSPGKHRPRETLGHLPVTEYGAIEPAPETPMISLPRWQLGERFNMINYNPNTTHALVYSDSRSIAVPQTFIFDGMANTGEAESSPMNVEGLSTPQIFYPK